MESCIKILAAGFLLLTNNLFAQSTSTTDKRRLSIADQKEYGKFIVEMIGGKRALIRNPNYDPSKFLKRDTSRSEFDKGTTEICLAGSDIPIKKSDLIYEGKSIASEYIMPVSERVEKYHSDRRVWVVHLKPGVVPITISQLLKKFNITPDLGNLPVYCDFKPVPIPADVSVIPQSVYKVNYVTDNDGFKFLNIVTKNWEENRKKYGDSVLWIK